MILKKDNLKVGLVLGLLGPIVGLAVVYVVSYRAFTFGEFFNFFITDNKRITSIGALSLLANAVLFTLYINTHRETLDWLRERVDRIAADADALGTLR